MKIEMEELERMMKNNGGSLYLGGTAITELPDNLTVGGSLYLGGTAITELPDNLTVGGYLYLGGTAITELPDNLTVGGYLYLGGTSITELPDNLTVGGSLYLGGTAITELPDNLTVGGYLYLGGTAITELPDNLTVGGSLYLGGTSIKELPDNLTVGGYLDLEGTSIKDTSKVIELMDGDYSEGKYLYADKILTHIKAKKEIKGGYQYFIGKIPNKNVIYDGTNYAHCSNLRQGISDLDFKKASDRGLDQYTNLNTESIVTFDEARTMYRIITGACSQGTESFIDNMGDKRQESYTIKELLAITAGHYGNETLKRFFEGRE